MKKNKEISDFSHNSPRDGTRQRRRLASVRGQKERTTHHPSLACRQEHTCRVRPATFSKDMVGAEAQTAAEGRWHGRSHRSSVSVDGLITACVGLTAEEGSGWRAVGRRSYRYRVDFTLAGIPETFKESKGLIDGMEKVELVCALYWQGVARALSRLSTYRLWCGVVICDCYSMITKKIPSTPQKNPKTQRSPIIKKKKNYKSHKATK
jgi:hypothetical protein